MRDCALLSADGTEGCAAVEENQCHVTQSHRYATIRTIFRCEMLPNEASPTVAIEWNAADGKLDALTLNQDYRVLVDMQPFSLL